MKSKKIMAAIMALTVAATVGLAGCGKSTSNTSGDASNSGMDKDQHITISVPVNDVKTMDPSKSTDLYSGYVLTETMEALAREEVKDGKDIFAKAGASDWKVSSDGLTWTFTIRDNKWSDGKAVTAGDYEYAIKRTLAKDTASQYAYLLVGAGIKGAAEYNKGKGTADQVGITAKDDKTLVITLNSPCAYFEKLLAFKLFIPQRKDLVEKYGDKFGSTADTMVYNGPFKIDSLQMGADIKLSKNDSYWDKDSVKLSKATIKFMKDETARMNSLTNGEIDISAVNSKEWLDKFSADSKFVKYDVTDPSTNYDFFNTKDPIFKNANVRKAFILAFDRDAYVKALWEGLGKPAYSWVPDAMMIGNDKYRDKVPEQLKASKEDPKELLKKGLAELGMDPDPSKLTIEYLNGGTDERAKSIGDFEINNYKEKLGVNFKVTYMEWAQFQKQCDDGKYQMAGMAWMGDYNDPMTFFDMWMTGAGIVVNYWSNPEYDALIQDAQSTMDMAKRLDDFKKAEDILLNKEAVISPTNFREIHSFAPSYVKGVMRPVFGSGVELKYIYTSGR